MSEIAQGRFSVPQVAGVGFAIGWVLLFVAFFLTFTICSDTTFAKLLFPFAIFADPSLHDRWWLALFVALAQYPLYFGTIAFVRERKRSLIGLCIVAVCILHIAGMFGASARETALHNRIWQNAQSP